MKTDVERPPAAAGARDRRYLYAIVPGGDADAGRACLLPHLEISRTGAVCAVTGEVPAAIAAGAGQLSMVALEEAAREHEHVAEHVLGWASSMVPIRFGTVISSTTAVGRLLRDHADAFGAALEQVRGRREWAVAVSWDAEHANRAARDRLGAADGTAPRGPGQNYLAVRRQERALSQSLAAACEELAACVEAALDPLADSKRSYGLRDAAQASRGSDVAGPRFIQVLKMALLVSPADEARLVPWIDGAVRRYEGVSATVSGPWPPYSFVEVPGLVTT